MAEEIFALHRDLFRADVANSRLILSNFPVATPPGSWEARTRGNTIVIISSDMPFKTQSLQRLHEQLRHEMFHLWIPNGVNLTGNYDWFYEGFALYRSLKLAVGANRIRFEDFLDTLSRAHTIDSAGSQKVSLIQASAARFAGANTQVYARGMLVAFLCDLAVMGKSNGKRSVETILRELYTTHRKPAAPVDGNTIVLTLLRSHPELNPIVDKYITGVDRIDWTAELAAAGIKDEDPGPITTLRVLEKPRGRQKAMLDKLGYNNWRRLTPKSK
jgi:predicted metalloprotease with PDZ domain